MKKALLILTAVTGLAIANTASAELTAGQKQMAASRLSQKEKGQPHHEDSTATTQRNPMSALRISGALLKRNEARRATGPGPLPPPLHDAPRNTRLVSAASYQSSHHC